MTRGSRSMLGALTVVVLLAGACSGDDDATTTTARATTTLAPTTAPSTSAPGTTATTASPTTVAGEATTTPAATEPPATVPPPATGDDLLGVVTRLAADDFTGRNEQTDGWLAAQVYLAEQLATFAEPIDAGAEDTDGFLQHTATSVNVIGVVRGTDLPDEYVLVGAHYDGLGIGDCDTLDPADTICNGAADNAAGVAVALDAVQRVVAGTPPRRSLLVVFWDREEDGLVGSAEFVADPVVPLDQIVAYVNFDIQGANLSPSLRSSTIAVGAETGGPALVAALTRAAEASSLATVGLSLIFGQGRSDHASLVAGGVPSVFFTDANNGCYHTAQDDLDHLDTAKLAQQAATATALIGDLASGATSPEFHPDAPLASFADAEAMLGLVSTGQPDFDLLAPEDQAAADTYVADLERIVAEGEAAFDDADVGVLLGGAAALVGALADVACDAYLG